MNILGALLIAFGIVAVFDYVDSVVTTLLMERKRKRKP